ncbi:flippase [Flammeovirga pacifica]|uniref:Uncharacterized protein n=1 Tax=Flammeovirga pacifica TaxID=915059 RepID=A0A1S1YXH8_FLAPC|nr:flippase [Flammeovirga pacifica]OHX65698.1 hypothetical protein NH26_04705 [Flammeovirga pacifica]
MASFFQQVRNWLQKDGVVSIIKNMNWLAFDKISRILVGLFINAWVRRYLGVETVGLWDYVIALGMMFYNLSTFGMERIVIRDLVSKKFDQTAILGTTFFFRAFSSIISAAAVFVYVSYFSDKSSGLLITLGAIVASGILFQTSDIVQYYYQSILKSKRAVIAKNISFLSLSLIKILLIVNNQSVEMFALVNTIDLMIGCLLMFFFYFRDTHLLSKWYLNKKYLKQLIKDSWPLAVSSLAFVLYSKIDQLMLGEMKETTYDIGIYATASKLYDIPISVIGVIIASVYPPFIQLFNRQDKSMFFDRYKKTTAGLTLLGYLGFLFNLFFGEYIILFLFGEDFLPAHKIFSIQCLSAILMFNAALRSNYLSLTDQQKVIMYSTIFGATANIVLNLYLIPDYGAVGAAYATLITQLISLYVVSIFFKEARSITYIQLRNLFLLDLRRFLK